MTRKWHLWILAVFGVWSGWGVSVLEAQTFTEIAASLEMSVSGIGATWGDYDGDGDLDLYVASEGIPNQLYRNNGDGTFTDVAASAGVDDPGPGAAVICGDYDNDGDLDIFLSNWQLEGICRLYRNNGDGKFVEVGASAGLSEAGGWRPPAWGDYDNDGDLDLYVVKFDDVGRLYQNGNGTFTNVATNAGMDVSSFERVPRWGDYDNDGDLDLYVTSFGGGNRLYQNRGDGKFTNVAKTSGVDDGDTADLGVAWGDYDNDGNLDLLVTNQEAAQRLYRNKGDGTFVDVAASAGVADTAPGHGVNWGDYDNDGDLDFYMILHEAKHRLYRNNGDGTFTDVAVNLGMDFGPNLAGSDAAWGDYDNDGDLDLYVTNVKPELNLLYRNEGTSNHWLHVKLQGTTSNRSAIGTRVTAVTGDKRQIWEVDGGTGFCSQPSLPVEFGFGQTAMVDSLIIRWPSGIVQTFTGLETNQRLAITEDNPLITAVEEEETATLPRAFSLSQNFPNPFNPQTTIHYQVPEEAEIRLTILDLAGQEVRMLAGGSHQPGQYSAVWDGMDASGRAVASGVYVYRLEVKEQGIIETKRMALVR